MLGRLMVRRLNAALATLVGLAIWIFLISIAAHFRVNTPLVYGVAFALPYLAPRVWPDLRTAWPRATPGHAVLIFILMMQWLVALKPEVGADGLAMHLAIPAMVAQDGRFGFDFQSYSWALMPMGGDFAFTGVYLLGGEAAARLLNFALLALMAAMVYSASRRWLSPGWAAIATALFASTPLVQLVTGSLFVENVWAALILGAGVALWSGEVTVGAILLGSAMSVKLGTSAYLLPAAVLGWLALRKTEQRLRTAMVATLLLIVFAIPPFLYAWVKTGNPIFPFANSFFRSPYFDPVSIADTRYRPSHDWNGLYDLTFRSARFIEGQGGALGFQYFLLLAPLLLLLCIAFRTKAPRAPVLFALTGAVITFVSLPNLRYVYPALALLSIGIGWLLAELPALSMAIIPMTALNIWFMPASGWHHREFALFNQSQFEEYLQGSAPPRKLVDIVNRIAPGQPVGFLNGDPIAGLHARAYSDTWHTYRFWKRMIDAPESAQVAVLYHEHGIHYVITPMPPPGEYLVVQHFVEEWTAPTGYALNHWELRSVLDQPVAKPREVSPVGPGTYDDMDQGIEYSGFWLHDRQFAESAGRSITYSNHPGDTLRFFFSGRSLTYVYTQAANRGTAEILIDRQSRGRVDLYSGDTKWQQKTVFGGLDPGPHSLELRILKRKDPHASDYFVDVDALVVEP